MYMEKPKKKYKPKKVMVTMYEETWDDLIATLRMGVKNPIGDYWVAKDRIENRLAKFKQQGKPKD